jgi:sterol desaturase/sphingolipid hydroxylase (fatty acid hydroxylase superfamily)
MEIALTLGFLGIYGGLVVHDLVRPARAFPRIRAWGLKGGLFFAAYFAVSGFAPLLWDAWLADHRVLDLTGLGIAGGAVVGLLGVELVLYWWHRALHRVPVLWRWFHQMHHSPERVDSLSAFVFHPLDMLGFTFVASFSLVMVFGVRVEAAIIAITIANTLAIFGHANVRTPRWLGYLIQRPENHAAHHERGIHGRNFGDIALWDMVFGTWHNPKTWEGAAGFWDGASERIGAMLLGRDVSRPPATATVDATTSSLPLEPIPEQPTQRPRRAA